MKKENKQAIIAVVIMLSIIAMLVGIFCAVWFTVPINVLDKIEDVCNSSETAQIFFRGRKYEIPTNKAIDIIKSELAGIKFVNTVPDYRLADFLDLIVGDKYVVFLYDKINIGGSLYKGDGLNNGELMSRLVAEGIFIPDPNDPEYNMIILTQL